MLEDLMDQAPVADNSRAEREKTRWVVFAGDDMPAQFKRQFKGAHIGGVYLGHDYKTLHLTKHMLRRCELTPMVVGYDFLNTDSLGPDKSRCEMFQSYNEITRQMETQYAWKQLPGDELASLMQDMSGPNDMGIREVSLLAGVSAPRPNGEGGFTRTRADELQLEIFPDWPKYMKPPGHDEHLPFFPTTMALRNYLENRRQEVPPDAQEVIDVILESNQVYDNWVGVQLSRKGELVKAGVDDNGRVFSWQSHDWQRFDQTGRNKDQFLQRKQEDNSVSKEDLMQLFREAIQAKQPEKPAEADEHIGMLVTVGDRQGEVIEKKGGGYYSVRFPDGDQNLRPNQWAI